MALTIDPATKTVTIPQSDLLFITGTLYELDTNQFRLDLGALLDDEAYIWMDTPIRHNTEVTIVGLVLGRVIEMINSWMVVFSPDAQYSVRFTGSNNNLFDVEGLVLVQNQVQVIPNNSAGLQTVAVAGGMTTAQAADLQLVLDIMEGDHIEQATSLVINKKDTLTKVLNKKVLGSLLPTDIVIRTEEP